MRLSLTIFALALVMSCSERTHRRGILLHIVTNAPVSDEHRLFHRIRVSLLAPGESTPCATCTRSLDMVTPEASVGLVPERTLEGYRAEVILYRAQTDDVPRAESSIAQSVELPQLPPAKELNVTMFLDVVDVGKKVDNSLGLVGHLDPWTKADPVPCNAELGAREVCVPGGAFWMGSPATATGQALSDDGQHERIVVLSPFVLDAYEVSDADFRAARAVPYEIMDDGCGAHPSSSAPSNLPVRCVTWQQADWYCTQRKARLPTEAELEFVQGGQRSTGYPWGDTIPTCNDANYGALVGCATSKMPASGGSFLRDSLTCNARTIFDLVGNVSEFAQDRYQVFGEACWPSGILTNPVCTTSGNVAWRSVRGGSFIRSSETLRSSYRIYIEDEARAVSASVGFRCARSIE